MSDDICPFWELNIRAISYPMVIFYNKIKSTIFLFAMAWAKDVREGEKMDGVR